MQEAGRYGGSMRFVDPKAKAVVLYKGENNVAYASDGWSGSVSIWLQLDPAKDLAPGYSDPIQITDKKWNDASLFLDFTKDNPRDFRLGVFSDLAFWNPDDTPWDKTARG